MTDKLKPCPFCGPEKSDPELIDHRTDWFIRCNGCNVIVYGETVNHLDHINDDEEAQTAFDAVDWDALRQTSIDKWNARAPSSTKELLQLKELEGEELAKDKKDLIDMLDSVINHKESHAMIDWAICGIYANSSSDSPGRDSRMKQFYSYKDSLNAANQLLDRLRQEKA